MSREFVPSQAELALTTAIFNQADPNKLGILTGEVAVGIFGGAKLSSTVLGEIWSIADEEDHGWLSKKGVAVAIRLIGYAQNGEKVSKSLLSKRTCNAPSIRRGRDSVLPAGPVPVIEGIPIPAFQQTIVVSSPKSPPPGLPPLTQANRNRYRLIFEKSGPISGLLTSGCPS